MAMERHFYEQWSAGSTQRQDSSYRKKSRSRSPLRNGGRKKPYNSNLLSEMKLMMKDVDFEKERREIDLEMQRRDEMERKEMEKKKSDNVVKENNIIPGIVERDLHLMLEKSQDTATKNVSSPPIPPSTHVKDLANIVPIPVVTSRVNETIPGFDYTHLGNEPSSVNENRPLEIFSNEGPNDRDEKCDLKREELAENFKRDCDTIAFVTQLLINENPALEQPLVEALNGVLQKVRRKHMGLLER